MAGVATHSAARVLPALWLQAPGSQGPLLLCQHHYLVANAQERGIPLQQVEGTFTVITSADWILEQVEGDFRMILDAGASSEEQGRADAEAIAYIKERMKLCPVSRNLPQVVQKSITLELQT